MATECNADRKQPIRKGNRVRYRIGIGYGEAKVAEIANGRAQLVTSKGAKISRKVDALERV